MRDTARPRNDAGYRGRFASEVPQLVLIGGLILGEDNNTGWAVVISNSAAEELAEKSLRAAGWRVYLPRGRKILLGHRIDPRTGRRIRTRGHGEIVMRPAFTGYLFAEVHPGQDWSPMLSERGVNKLLRRGTGTLRMLSPEGLETIRAFENAGDFDEPRCRRGKDRKRTDLEVGSRVLFEPAAGITVEAVIEKLNDNDGAILSWIIFGRETKTTVNDVSELELAHS